MPVQRLVWGTFVLKVMMLQFNCNQQWSHKHTNTGRGNRKLVVRKTHKIGTSSLPCNLNRSQCAIVENVFCTWFGVCQNQASINEIVGGRKGNGKVNYKRAHTFCCSQQTATLEWICHSLCFGDKRISKCNLWFVSVSDRRVEWLTTSSRRDYMLTTFFKKWVFRVFFDELNVKTLVTNSRKSSKQ